MFFNYLLLRTLINNNKIIPKMYNLNLKERPLLLEPGKQSYCLFDSFKDLSSSIQEFIKTKPFSPGRPSPVLIKY